MSADEHARAATQARDQNGFKLFDVTGIEIRIHPSWFLILLLVVMSLALGYLPRAHPDLSGPTYWLAGLVTGLSFFACILIHELAHAWTARASGIEVRGISLFLFGGVSHMGAEADEPLTDLRIAAAGPLASFALAGVFAVAHRAVGPELPGIASGTLAYLSWINAALGVFNLLPGMPLDGGRILRAAAWWWTGSLRRGTRIATRAGKGLAYGLMFLGGIQIFGGAIVGGIWLILIALFLRGTAEAGYQSLVIRQSLGDVVVGEVALRDPVTVPPTLSLRTLADDYFLGRGFRAFPVVDGATVQGLVTIRGLREVEREDWGTRTVKDVLVPIGSAIVVSPDTPLVEALEKLEGAPDGRLLVMRGDVLEGVLSKDGLTRFLEIRQIVPHADDRKPDA